MAAAVIAHTSAILNSSVALYAIDFHDKFIRQVHNHWRLANNCVCRVHHYLMLVPAFRGCQKSIINLLQELNGLSSMPVLSSFIAGLLFANVDARAAIFGLIYGVGVYAFHTFVLYRPSAVYVGETFYQHIGLRSLHYISGVLIVLVTSVLVALIANRLIFGNHARYVGPGATRHV